MKCWKYYIYIFNFAIQFLSLKENEDQIQNCPTLSQIEMKSRPFVTFKNGTLQPKKSIAFLKTHKCSSTTIQNILFRYAQKHKLNLVLGKSGNWIGYPDGFSIQSIENTPWYQAGI